LKLKKQQKNINEGIYLPACEEMHNFPEKRKRSLFIREISVEKIMRKERKK
jgi:hypothetical protein